MLTLLRRFLGLSVSPLPILQRPSKLPDNVVTINETPATVNDLKRGQVYTIEKIGSRWKVLDADGNPLHSSRTRVAAQDWVISHAPKS